MLAAVCGLALHAANAHQHQACVGLHNDGTYKFMPSPQSCNRYILCYNGESHIDECPDGMHFDAGRQACGDATHIDCTQCGPIGFVRLPHPDDCVRFFECTFGIRKERTCPEGHLFDREVGACNRAENVFSCGYGSDPYDPSPSLEPPGGTGNPNDPDDPDYNGVLPTCRRGQVHHAHASNCNKYYLCVQGTLWEHRCPSKLHWNERAMACDLVKNAGCVLNGGGFNPQPDGNPPIQPDADEGGANQPDVGGPPPFQPLGNGRRLVRLAKDDMLF